MKKYWGNMRQLLLTVFKWQGISEIAAEEMAALPGMNEGSVLLWLEQFYRSGEYDLIVVDSAPTGETLTLLSLPQVTQWWVARAFPFQKTAIRTAGFALRKTTGIPLDKGYEELDKLFEKLKSIQAVLSNPAVSSVRLVTNPERMVIEEARRAYSYLQLYGYAVDAVIVNRVLPMEGAGEVLKNYVRAQAAYLEEIAGSFSPLPILQVPHSGEEVFGLDRLRRVADAIYAEVEPTAVLYQGQTYRLNAEGREYVLDLRMPVLDGAEISARQFGDELVIQLGNQRRNYLLPKFLAYYRVRDSRVSNGWFRVRFSPA
jgi:arsenite/tail-anchored protein-transporting ATPase